MVAAASFNCPYMGTPSGFCVKLAGSTGKFRTLGSFVIVFS